MGRFPDSATMAIIPRTIRALAIGGAPHSDSLDVDGLVQQLATFPNLKTFTWGSSPKPLPSASLQSMCAKCGIELRTAGTDVVVG